VDIVHIWMVLFVDCGQNTQRGFHCFQTLLHDVSTMIQTIPRTAPGDYPAPSGLRLKVISRAFLRRRYGQLSFAKNMSRFGIRQIEPLAKIVGDNVTPRRFRRVTLFHLTCSLA
jgi:hypothetical protein